MPLYEYKCLKCGRHTDKIERVAGPHLKKCPHCGGKVESVITAPAIKFKGSGWRGALVPGIVVCAMYFYTASRGDALFPIHSFPWWLFALLTAAVPFLFRFTAANPIDRFAGDLSYPIYVNHFVIIQLVGSLIAPIGILFAAVSIAFAAATVFIVERPARRLKFRPKLMIV